MLTHKHSRNLWLSILISGILISALPVSAQSNYRLYFTKIKPVEHERVSLFQQRVSSRFELSWEVYEELDGLEVKSEENTISNFQIAAVAPNDSVIKQIKVSDLRYTTEILQMGSKHGFIIKGIDPQGVTIESETAWITPGICAIQDSPDENVVFAKGTEFINYLSGKALASIIKHGDVWDTSNTWGKASFCILQYLLIGGLIFLVISWWHLRMKKIFPMQQTLRPSKNVTECYKNFIDREFDDFSYDAKRDISNNLLDGKIEKSTLERFSIFKKWFFIVLKNKHDMKTYINENEFDSLDKLQVEHIKIWQQNNWSVLVREEIIDKIKEKKFDEYPIGRIFIAGLENYEHGGLKWMDVSVEVDRAMENRVESELDTLERNSKMNWLMNIGTVAPMVGLLGTATGISQAFQKMEGLPLHTTHQEVTKTLAGGIYSALWTTVLGLLIALFFLFSYYYFQHKLDRIHAKWKELYLKISELL